MSEPNEPMNTDEPTSAETPTPKSYVSKVLPTEEVRRGIRPRTAKRLAIMAVILVLMGYLFYWFVGQKGDLQFASDTSKMIGAIRLQGSGSQAVVVDPDGKITPSSGYADGKSDRDLAWDPKGNRLFFISDRKEDSYHIFRWDPQRNGDPEQRTIDKASRSDLVFDAQDKGTGDLSGLVIVRGTVVEFTPKTAKSEQLMPPTRQIQSGDASGGKTGNFEMLYSRYGTSFKSARWFFNRRYIGTVMRREDKGEALVIQDSVPDDKGNLKPPQLVFVAEKIGITVDPVSGGLVFNVIEILPPVDAEGKPQVGPDGKPITYPFSHGLFRTVQKDGNITIEFIGPSPTKEISLGTPVVSPDGNSVMFPVGKYQGDGNMEVQGLVTCPLVEKGVQSGSQLAVGTITDPTFSPDGRKIAYIKQEGGHQAIFLAASDGSGAKNLTGTNGDFSLPRFSPQYK